MKKSLTVITLLAGAVGLYAQGTLQLSAYNEHNSSTLIYAPQLANPGTQVYGAGANDINSGGTAYTGTPIGGGSTGSGATAYGNGANYTIAVFAAPGENNLAGLTAAESSIANAVLTSQFLTSGGTGAANAGTANGDSAGMYAAYYNSLVAQNLGSGFSGGATIQIEAWYSGSGNTYAEDAAGTGLPYGVSAIGEVATLGGNGSPPATATTLNGAGIYSFSLEVNPAVSTPEPSTIALGVIGASTLLFRRRK